MIITRRCLKSRRQILDGFTSHFYERKGSVKPGRTEGGTRRYIDNDLVTLHRIAELLAQAQSFKYQAGVDSGNREQGLADKTHLQIRQLRPPRLKRAVSPAARKMFPDHKAPEIR